MNITIYGNFFYLNEFGLQFLKTVIKNFANNILQL
jgi:hypothetical protein